MVVNMVAERGDMLPGDRDMEGHGAEGKRGDRDKNRGGETAIATVVVTATTRRRTRQLPT